MRLARRRNLSHRDLGVPSNAHDALCGLQVTCFERAWWQDCGVAAQSLSARLRAVGFYYLCCCRQDKKSQQIPTDPNSDLAASGCLEAALTPAV
jgi:hypothetical protein